MTLYNNKSLALHSSLTSNHSLRINNDRVDLSISIILYCTSFEELTVVNGIQISSAWQRESLLKHGSLEM